MRPLGAFSVIVSTCNHEDKEQNRQGPKTKQG